MTTRGEIQRWFEEGVADKSASHLIVVCDTFDHEDYPIYVRKGDDFYKAYDAHNDVNMQRIMEVYDLAKPMKPQLEAVRVFNMPERGATTKETE